MPKTSSCERIAYCDFSGCDFVSVLHFAAGELLEPQAAKSYRAFGELKVALSQNPIRGPGGPAKFLFAGDRQRRFEQGALTPVICGPASGAGTPGSDAGHRHHAW